METNVFVIWRLAVKTKMHNKQIIIETYLGLFSNLLFEATFLQPCKFSSFFLFLSLLSSLTYFCTTCIARPLFMLCEKKCIVGHMCGKVPALVFLFVFRTRAKIKAIYWLKCNCLLPLIFGYCIRQLPIFSNSSHHKKIIRTHIHWI